jgi:hypothetical protein
MLGCGGFWLKLWPIGLLHFVGTAPKCAAGLSVVQIDTPIHFRVVGCMAGGTRISSQVVTSSEYSGSADRVLAVGRTTRQRGLRSSCSRQRKRWNMSSSGYPALTLASCMAREIAFFSSAALPAFIVTVNNGMRVSQ